MRITPLQSGGSAPIDISPSPLLSGLNPLAYGFQGAARKINVTTRNGVWELDDRYRRWQSKPTRVVTTTDITTDCKTASGFGTSVPRTGSTDAWSNPSAVATIDNNASSIANMGVDETTEFLRVASLVAVGDIPTSATVDSIKLKVRHKSTGTVPIGMDSLFPLNNLLTLGTNLGTNQVVPSDWETLEFSLSTSIFTIADFNSDLIGARVGYNSLVTADHNDPANWSFSVSPSGTTNTTGGANSTVTNVKTVTVSYTGPGSPPPFVYFNLTSSATVSAPYLGTPPTPAADWIGTADIDNGIGDTASGTIEAPTVDYPGSISVTGSETVKITMSGSSGTYVVNQVGSTAVSGTGFDSVSVSGSVTGTFVAYTTSALEVDFMGIEVCYTVDASETYELVGPGGIGYGNFGVTDEYSAVWGESVFDVVASYLSAAMGSNWSTERYNGLLGSDRRFVMWQYGPYLFYTHKEAGTFFKTIGGSDFQGLFRDYSFNGVGSIDPQGWTARPWRAADDVVTLTATNLNSSITYEYLEEEVTLKAATNFNGQNYTGNLVFDWSLAGDEDWSEYDYVCIVIDSGPGFPEHLVTSTPIEVFTDDGVTSAWRALEVKQYITGRRSGTGSATTTTQQWAVVARIKGVTDIEHVTKVNIPLRGKPQQINNSNSVIFKVRNIIFGRSYLLADSGDRLWDSTVESGQIEYAFRYINNTTSQVSAATTFRLDASDSIGPRYLSWIPALGSRVEINAIASTQAPFLEEADETGPFDVEIQFLRKDKDGDWRLLGELPNYQGQVWVDDLEDHEVQALPLVTDFSTETDSSVFGIVTGVTCGCAWKGANVYGASDGKVYFSAANNYRDVLWDGITVTNEATNDKSGARTDVLADNTVDPPVAMVPAENLYVLTAREAYVYVSGDTAATASFPRKIDGARGVVGPYAAAVYGDRCVYGAKDGLWAIKKTSAESGQPDELTELTENIEDSWTWLLGDSPEGLVVVENFRNLWCFNEDRFLHFDQDGGWSEGQWADGRQVYAAVSDPLRGVVMQMVDGSLGVIGEFATDGASNLSGTNGIEPTWIYETGKEALELEASRFKANVEGDVAFQFATENGTSTISKAWTGAAHNVPIPRKFSGKRGAVKTLTLTMTGSADAVVGGFILVGARRSMSRAER